MTQPSNQQIRRMLGPVPPTKDGEPPKPRYVIETKLNESDYDPDAWVALESVVDRWIRGE